MGPLKINIAGFSFDLISNDTESLDILRRGCAPFLSRGKPDFRAYLEFGNKRKVRRKVFDISHKWSAGKIFIKTPYFDADIDCKRNLIDVVAGVEYGIGGILRILCAGLLIREGGFLIHASSILKKRKNISYIFSGPSESGKTTIARLARDLVLTDETTAVRPDRKTYRAYSTPFSGEFGNVEENAAGPVGAVFFIQKSRSFGHARLEPRDALSRLLCNAMSRPADPETTDRLITNFSRFTERVPCYELAVRPVPGLWGYIDEHIEKHI